MRFAIILAVVLLLLAGSVVSQQHDGIQCMACDVVIFSIETAVIQDSKPIEQAVEEFCKKHFNGTWIETVCDELMGVYGDEIIRLLLLGANPDEVCKGIDVCHNKTCGLYKRSDDFFQIPLPQFDHGDFSPYELFNKARLAALAKKAAERTDPRFNPFDYITEIIDKVFDKHLPLFDFDNDTYSDWATLRGSDWRGKDCDDYNSKVYPGRASTAESAAVDHNCNGILGADSQGRSYEELLCANTQQRGIVAFGDSAAAKFHIPSMTGPLQPTPQQWEQCAENEMDYPQCSWSTGHQTTGNCPPSPLSSGMDSIYLRMWQRNHCNMRDFQSIVVNGARSTSMYQHIMKDAFRRSQTEDQPMLVFYALVGNDVCNGHAGNHSMTYPAEFEQMVIGAMEYLDTLLPAGSHVFFIGLEDGPQWDIMAEQMHPLNVTYAQLWAFLSCYDMNPCWGWLNPDPWWRQFTRDLAAQLNAVYPKVISQHSYQHFDMHYLGNFQRTNLNKWMAAGNPGPDMFEWVGGGHPSQLNHEMDAASIWAAIEAVAPEALGPVNPNNALIEQLFGDQGGY